MEGERATTRKEKATMHVEQRWQAEDVASPRRKELRMKRVILIVSVMVTALLVASGAAWAATIVGTNGNDTRSGTANADQMYGLNGNDRLTGGAGNDQIEGGAGGDTLIGGADNDVVDGGNGNDTLNTSLASATFGSHNEAYGGTGMDTINANNGAKDEVYAGMGNDTINSRDGAFDRIDCGWYQTPDTFTSDFDTLTRDNFDTVVDCENILP
jgi:Ca2+-binding RTX toxin-like protein